MISRPANLLFTFLALAVVLGVLLLGGAQEFPRADSQPPASPAVDTGGAKPAASATASPATAQKAAPSTTPGRVPDPDRIGPCPKHHSPVVRQGLDDQGRPTWWHEDGSMTLKVRQTYTQGDQTTILHSTVVVRPAPSMPDPEKPARAK